MKIDNREVNVFKVKNRRGYAALCDDHLTEGDSQQEALDRMMKALKRTEKKIIKR